MRQAGSVKLNIPLLQADRLYELGECHSLMDDMVMLAQFDI
jgi:hypothetical protein